MRPFIFGFAMMVALSAPCVAADGPGSALGSFVGSWTGSGQMFKTDFSPAAVIQGRTKCAWSDDRLFLICQQSAVMNGQTLPDVTIYTYDAAAKQFHFYNITMQNANATQLTNQGKTWTYTDHFTNNGKTAYFRTSNVFADADHYTFKTEYSYDQSTWVLMNTGTSVRAGSAP